ncbi:MAG: CdaR family protein [Bacilli bacterium]|nr:CdaR family protein [Bacilli bacterium]MDD4282197.1 CdaR family protein [Bacilli bacterium]MDD4719194.1 CdaR family protein [Bacilli bacterium]
MKLVIKIIKNFFSAIWLFIDKRIIVSITRFILSITKKFDKSGKKIENWLSKTNTLLFISLFFAVVIFIVIDQKIITFSENSAEVLKNQEVKVIYNEEAYVVEGIPETVDITLIGKKAELMFAKQSSIHDVSIDLTGLKPGTHKVNVTYKQAMQSIDYKVNPSIATIVIYPKIPEIKTLTLDLLNQDSLSSKLVIDDVIVNNDKVIVKGAEHKLKEVATVKALIDIRNLVKQEEGTTTLKDIPLKAYNNKGEIVDVEIVPDKITADIKITSPSKEIPIRVIPVGDLGFGKAISGIDINETKVTVYGNEDVLAALNYIPLEIDVNELKENRQYKMEIPKPVGVKSMSINNVTINISVGNSVDKEIKGIQIEYRNLNEIYTVQGLSKEDVAVIVGLKGVESVLNQIESTNITAYLDLKGYGEGEHEVEVKVEGTDVKVIYIAKTKKVRIKIIKIN